MVVRPTRESLIFQTRNSQPEGESDVSAATPSQDDWLKLELNNAIESDQSLWTPAQQHFRASWIGEPCARALTLKAAGHQVPHRAKTLRIFAVGRAIEDSIVDSIRRAGLFKDAQLKVEYTDPKIRGTLDVQIGRDDVKILGEIKSINSHGFKSLPKEHGFMLAGQSPLMKKKPGYVHQLNGYLVMAALERGFLLFENKDDGEQRCYWLLRDGELFERGVAPMRDAQRYVNADPQEIAPIPLDRNPIKGDEICSGCAHRYICKRVPTEGSTIDRTRELDAEIRG